MTCSGCGTSCYWPVPDAAAVARAYPPEYVDGFTARYWPEYWKGRRYAAGLARFRPEGDYLDVGCGVGTMLAGIRDFSRWRPRGLETSRLAVETGRTLHGAEMAPGDVFTAGGASSSADWILVNNVLEHVPDPKAFLAKCADLLRSGGRLHLLVPNGPVDLSPNLLWFQRGVVLKTKHAGHLYFFTARAIRRLLEQAGFRILRFTTFHIKAALKARGWFPPDADDRFCRDFSMGGGEDAAPTRASTAATVPPRAAWGAYQVKAAIHSVRYPVIGNGWGYDYDILCEK